SSRPGAGVLGNGLHAGAPARAGRRNGFPSRALRARPNFGILDSLHFRAGGGGNHFRSRPWAGGREMGRPTSLGDSARSPLLTSSRRPGERAYFHHLWTKSLPSTFPGSFDL